VVSHFFPLPPRAGNERRLYHLLRWLRGRGFDVVLVVNALHQRLAPERVRQLRGEVYALELVGQPLSRLARLPWPAPQVLARARGLVSVARSRLERPRSRLEQIEDDFCPPPLLRALDRVVRRWQPQVMLAEYVFMSRCFRSAPPGVLKVIDTHDLFSTRHDNVVAHGIEDRLAISRDDEARLLRRADLVVVIQDHERRALQAMAPGLDVVTAGFDAEVAPRQAGAPVAGRVLLVGSDNAVNGRGLHDFLARAWPAVRAAQPDATLHVAGGLGRHRVATAGVVWRGIVADLTPEYAACQLVINPSIAGSGLKIKSAEALAQRRPLVAWPNGVAGLEADAPPYLVAADWDDFAAQVIALLGDASLRAKLDSRFDAYLERFAAARVYGELGRALDAWLSRS
jgi:glycosyltransferase involved in cell wall biosynthesis